MRYLLIGNGPAALAYDAGAQIDAFDGVVVRFNHYSLAHGEQTGTRTDQWVTVDDFPQQAAHTHPTGRVWANRAVHDLRQQAKCRRIGASPLPPAAWQSVPFNCTTGLAYANHLLRQGQEVLLYGFDFMEPPRQHHFGDAQDRGPDHDACAEWQWFHDRMHLESIRVFGWDPSREGIPAVRRPVPCGTDLVPLSGREPCQAGWYATIADLLGDPDLSLLDVGAGSGQGVRLLWQRGCRASGWEPDERVPDFPGRIHVPLQDIPDRSFDAVCAIDVMEHVFHDLDFLRHLHRISSRHVFVSMPNFTRSRAANAHHAREYTIAQFWNRCRPDVLVVGSPDGHLHRTVLLYRGMHETLDYSAQGPDNAIMAPLVRHRHPLAPSLRFSNTVDGQEWPHFLGWWRR